MIPQLRNGFVKKPKLLVKSSLIVPGVIGTGYSTILSDEIEQIADLIKRSQNEILLSRAHQTIFAGTDIRARGKDIEILGFQELDALHIACAESGEVDIFLTTDDKLLRRAKRYHAQLHIRVENPSIWLQEVN